MLLRETTSKQVLLDWLQPSYLFSRMTAYTGYKIKLHMYSQQPEIVGKSNCTQLRWRNLFWTWTRTHWTSETIIQMCLQLAAQTLCWKSPRAQSVLVLATYANHDPPPHYSVYKWAQKICLVVSCVVNWVSHCFVTLVIYTGVLCCKLSDQKYKYHRIRNGNTKQDSTAVLPV